MGDHEISEEMLEWAKCMSLVYTEHQRGKPLTKKLTKCHFNLVSMVCWKDSDMSTCPKRSRLGIVSNSSPLWGSLPACGCKPRLDLPSRLCFAGALHFTWDANVIMLLPASLLLFSFMLDFEEMFI